MIDVAVTTSCAGLIATNTTLSRDNLSSVSDEAGGLSGAPLAERSDAVLAHLARACGDRMILIGVGGIFTADDLYRKIALGAHLAQVYTGWIYGGPSMVPTTLRGLADRMDREGIDSLSQLRGIGLGSAARPP